MIKILIGISISGPHNLNENKTAYSVKQGHILQNSEAGFKNQEIEHLGDSAPANQKILHHQVKESHVEEQIDNESGLEVAEEHCLIDDGGYVHICSSNWESWRFIVIQDWFYLIFCVHFPTNSGL